MDSGKELRLECLKQAMLFAPLKWNSFHNYSVDPSHIVSVAKAFEEYVLKEKQNEK